MFASGPYTSNGNSRRKPVSRMRRRPSWYNKEQENLTVSV
jgi:hypothetical protein